MRYGYDHRLNYAVVLCVALCVYLPPEALDVLNECSHDVRIDYHTYSYLPVHLKLLHNFS